MSLTCANINRYYGKFINLKYEKWIETTLLRMWIIMMHVVDGLRHVGLPSFLYIYIFFIFFYICTGWVSNIGQ